MANKMLIDASHPEETRVVVLRGNRVEEFDFESASRKQLRGNIYLAKVTRVEPSLQAAFVDYGGNRHGFLAFSEIHPDYYQIPVADRQALLDEEERAHAEESEEEQRPQRRSRRRRSGAEKRQSDPTLAGPAEEAGAETDAEMGDAPGGSFAAQDDASEQAVEAPHDEASASVYDASSSKAVDEAHDEATHPSAAADNGPSFSVAGAESDLPPSSAASSGEAAVGDLAARADDDTEPVSVSDPEMIGEPVVQITIIEEAVISEARSGEDAQEEEDDEEDEAEGEESVEQIGGDSVEEYRERRPRLRRQYKIQEVIKRRQVLLVQVVKEERGTKGAALTTYLSLAGRYSVLMPNTARGGGISRKITEAADRKRMKEIAQELEVPDGMGVILRTAGASRTKPEVKRDFEYLLRMWENVRELTLGSSAPTLVYEEGSLIKRSIRDLYGKEVEEVVVAGDGGFKEARDFMRLLIPSHVSNVKLWTEPQAIFAKNGVESQLDSMFSNVVTLRSGGYLVINQTEALVAIDVNSGRSTREHNIEDTALRTNLEASDEVARQLRLRDLAGLVVVDFIDMEENRNNRAVERRLKDALKNDRARIQVGRISHFGLLEMSRQRIRTGVLEGSSVVCPHCAGSGHVRSTSSVALHVLRILEDALVKNAQYNLIARVRTDIALYMLNQKRAHLSDLEHRFEVSISVLADETLTGTVNHAIERGEPATPPPSFARSTSVRIDSVTPPDLEDEIVEEAEDEAVGEGESLDDQGENGAETEEIDEDKSRKRRRRRRRGRPQGRDWSPGAESSGAQPDDAQPADDGLALIAEIGNDFPQSLASATVSDGDSDEVEAESFEMTGETPESEDESGEARPKRRSRRGGRRRRGGEPTEGPESMADGAEPALEPTSEFALADAGTPPAPSPSGPAGTADAPETQSSASPHDEPEPNDSLLRDLAPAPARTHREEQDPVSPPAVLESAPSALGETPRADTTPARAAPLPEAMIDPSAPKRSGWWQRAKQTFSGS